MAMTIKTQSSDRWKKRPGSFDSLKSHLAVKYKGDNGLGIPDLLPQPDGLVIPDDITPVVFRKRWEKRCSPPALLQHFFIDDFRFETVWNEPSRGVQSVTKGWIWASTSPNFSMYADWPHVLNMMQVYRTRLISRLWQDAGALVIPAVAWSDPASHHYCFAGLSSNQIIAINCYAYPKSDQEREYYLLGYHVMCDRITPRHIIFFGMPWKGCENDIPKTVFKRGKYGIWERSGV